MRSNRRWTKWLNHAVAVVAMLVAGLSGLPALVQAGYELPPGERITNLPAIPRNMPQKEAYENYDPVIGRNFDLKNFWMRADLRVRPEFRNGVCFGGAAPVNGACNQNAPGVGTQNAVTAGQNQPTAFGGRGANDFYVQQWVRLGFGYDLSQDVNFYMELIDSRTWGGNGNPNNAGNGGDPLNSQCNTITTGACSLGVRAAYVLVRNLGGVQGLSMKAGRQYVIFGNHSLFGHFDWANTGYSHDGVMFSYSTKAFDSYLGWFRNSETDLVQGAAVGSGGANIAGCNTAGGTGPCTNGATGTRTNTPDGGGDVDMFIFYNQIKSVPGFLIEPYYVLYLNMLSEQANAGQGIGTAKHSNQIRHMIGNRIEMRKGGFDLINEIAWQFGKMSDGVCSPIGAACPNGILDNSRNLSINAWATRNWLGYTMYDHKWKPRVAINLDYASGDGNANCVQNGQRCTTANTFENFFPTNHIHMGYMDVMAWKNMIQPAANLQFRPTERDHFEFWFNMFYLADKRDNWYRGSQGVYVFSKNANSESHVGDEADFTWTRMFADGKVALQATYGHLFTGAYIRQNLGVNSDQSWGYLSLWMNF